MHRQTVHELGVSFGVLEAPVMKAVVKLPIFISHTIFHSTLVFSHPGPHETIPFVVVGQVLGVPKGSMGDSPDSCIEHRGVAISFPDEGWFLV